MSTLLGNNYFVIPLFGFLVFIFSYLNSEKILGFFYKKTLGQREELYQLLDKLYVDTDRSKLSISLILASFGLGSIFFLAFWPNIIPGLLFGSIAVMFGWAAPKLILNNLWEKRCNRIVDQMIDGMTIMANGVKSGLSITQSMERVTANMTGPLPQEFTLILNQIRLGRSVEESLNEFGDRIPRQDVQMFVTAVNILKETGGNLAETFTTIVTTIRERQKIEKKIEAMTSQGTMQAIIVTLVPFALLVMFLLVDPTFVMPLFTKPLGWVALLMMLGLQVIGGIMMKKIVTIKV
ncbi:MAG: type II secretion system F family protein [Bdellovibrionales bacterium]|nr:type II secretion system F family protein [Bdellovibrionales bacterium]